MKVFMKQQLWLAPWHFSYCATEQGWAIKNITLYMIVRSINPDGYEYSRKYDRMWRKVRFEMIVDQ